VVAAGTIQRPRRHGSPQSMNFATDLIALQFCDGSLKRRIKSGTHSEEQAATSPVALLKPIQEF
jgi:hypothetical protein